MIEKSGPDHLAQLLAAGEELFTHPEWTDVPTDLTVGAEPSSEDDGDEEESAE